MTMHSHEHRGKRRRWRVGTPLVFAFSGALFIASAANSEGTDLRSGRTTDMAGLVTNEKKHVTSLESKAAGLAAQVDRLAASVDDVQVRAARRQAAALRPPAGREPVTGPGITVTLSDASREVRETSDQPINLLVVHQQDIQAVVNAMWRGGAKAITIQGQRVVTTTGIRCAGSSVELHGIPYSQPYVIQAVGDPTTLERTIDATYYLDVYRNQAALEDIAVGWSLEVERRIKAPAYAGLVGLTYAKPLVTTE